MSVLFSFGSFPIQKDVGVGASSAALQAREQVECSNGAARILFALLGVDLGPDGYLEGSMDLLEFRVRLIAITPAFIAEKTSGARSMSLGSKDALSRDSITESVDDLRVFAEVAHRAGALKVRWE